MKRTLTVLSGSVLAVVMNTTAVAQQGNDALLLLLDQFQSLRGELEVLRGMAEEQGNEIRRLQQDSLDRYTDLDSRISALYQDMDAGLTAAPAVAAASAAVAAPQASVSNVQSPAPVPTATAAVNTTASIQAVPTIQPGLLTEQQLYELALDSLLQASAFQQSIAQFDQYLAQYPDGRFVTNAYYWKGQAYVNLSMFSEARQTFEVIINDYPDGRKIEDAMYSLGTVYHRLGDNTRARQMLQDVRARFPNTSAANLADIYLRTIN